MKQFRLVHEGARTLAAKECLDCEEGLTVTFKKPTRSLEQNAKFHAMIADIVKSNTWQDAKYTASEWKTLLVSAHATAVLEMAPEIIRGLEGEMVSLRESTAGMSVDRLSSLIEYTYAWGIEHGIKFSEVYHADKR